MINFIDIHTNKLAPAFKKLLPRSMILYGLSGSGRTSICKALVSNLKELYGLENLGAIKGLLHASMVFASALSPVIFGLIIDIGFGILTISIISLLIISISTILPLLFKI